MRRFAIVCYGVAYATLSQPSDWEPHSHSDTTFVTEKGSELLVWYQQPGGSGQRTIESPLLELDKGHSNKSQIYSISFNRIIGTLASSTEDGIIKLWVLNKGIKIKAIVY